MLTSNFVGFKHLFPKGKVEFFLLSGFIMVGRQDGSPRRARQSVQLFPLWVLGVQITLQPPNLLLTEGIGHCLEV